MNGPVSENTLKAAKSFLCWNVFEHLSVQLIPLRDAVAYYYPPKNHFHSIIVFYDQHQMEQSQALFLLFHEAGHIKQWQEFKKRSNQEKFIEFINSDNDPEKQKFEQKAWLYGRELLNLFLLECNYHVTNILKQYDNYADKCIISYKDSG